MSIATKPESLFLIIPESPAGASFVHHPISRNPNPKRFRPYELRDTGEARTEWLGFFEELFVGIFWKLGRPVPYVFATADGRVRSLDAGCLKWLANRTPPEVRYHCDSRGYIEAVTPEPVLLARHEEDRDALVARVSWKKP